MQKQSQSHTLPPQQLAAKVREYEQFANDVLKADLQKAVEQRAKAQAEIEELEQLRRNVQQLQEQRNKVGPGVRACVRGTQQWAGGSRPAVVGV